MHQKTFQRLAVCAALAGTALAPQAFAATVIDFEPAALTDVYATAFGNNSFAHAGFTFTVNGVGTIDSAAALGSAAPSGNATQFYSNLNDSSLSMVSSNGASFSFSGFSAAFLPLDPASSQLTVIVARGTTTANTLVTKFWSFATSTASAQPFATYAAAADFSAFTGLKQLDFYACSIVAGVACTQPTLNNGQFALDNIVVNATAVPEPTTALLLALGLAGLGLRARRAR